MPKKKKPIEPAKRIYMILDKSGSMVNMVEGVLSGFEEYIIGAKRDIPDALFSLTLFDSDLIDIQPSQPIADIVPLTRETFVPGAWTPLYDAIGKVLTRAKADAAADDRVIIVVFTDGQENWSKVYTRDRIFNEVEWRKADGWAFMFFGANIDSYSASARIGVDRGNTANFQSTNVGIKTAMRMAARGSSAYATTGVPRNLVSDEDRNELEQGG